MRKKVSIRTIYSLLLALVLCFNAGKTFATHIVGGEMYYECLGGNNYRITLKVFRDCFLGQTGFDAPAYIGIYNNGGIVRQMDMPMNPSKIVSLPTTVISKCFIPPGNICVEQYIYDTIINLPPLTGGYTIMYQRCCRNNTILNLFNSGNVGSTYSTHIPDNSVVSCNASPRYKTYPPIFICSGVPLNYDHSATDSDGDSLVYSLCDTYEGGTPFDPQPFPPAAQPANTVVPWLSPYTGGSPMSSSPPVTIDPQTGIITGTPNMIGQWVVGVCASEYRNGVLIGVHKRDFQFNVVSCPLLVVSSLPSQQTFCFGRTVNFINNSVNSSAYRWDFGVTSLTNDTSNLVAPTYTYPDTGVYVVTLYANPGDTCGDTATTTFRIYPPLKPNYTPPPAQCVLTNSYNFAGIDSNVTTKVTYLWDFGTHATPQTSTQKNPTGIVFDSAGKYLVTYTVSDFGCNQTYTDTITVLPLPVPFFAKPTGQCINNNSYTFTGTGAITSGATYSWVFGPNANPTTGAAQTVNNVSYNAVGQYTVDLTMVDNGCTVTYSDTLNIYPLPQAAFDPTPGLGCAPFTMQFSDSSLAGTAINYLWTFGDGATDTVKNPTHIYTTPGVYTVSLRIITVDGCIDTLTFTTPNMVTVTPSPTALFSVDPLETTVSDPNFTITDLSTGALTCKLFFGDGDSSLNCATSHTYLQPGSYQIMQTVMDALGCADTFYVNVLVELESKIWIPNTFTPNRDLLNETFYPLMEGMTDYHFMIFDRWGLLLFETNDQLKGWDGTYKGNKCQQDTYVYKIDCTDVKAERKSYVGMVNLLR